MKAPAILSVGLSGQSVFLRVRAFARPGETVAAQALHSEPGGKAFNQAVAAARLGARARLLSAVGRDESARLCRERLDAEGVEARLLPKDDATAYAVIHTAADGENTVTVYPGAARRLTAADVEAAGALFAGADFLLLQCEAPEDAFCAALRMAERHGVRVLLDPAPCEPFARAHMRRASVLTPNAGEACALLGLSPGASDAAIAAAAAEVPVPFAVTLGARGVLLCSQGENQRIPAPRVHAADTTGAGDAFAAALAVRLAMGDALPDAAAFAVRCAARSTRFAHVLDGLARAGETEA